MFSGYVQKRTTPISPPPMQRVFSVLCGTLLMDYETEEESKLSMSPRLCVEVLGVSEWDGRGRANNYMYGFLIVTHTGATYYVSVPTLQERDEWVLQLKRSLECVFANPEVVPFKPSKILSTRPNLSNNTICPASKNIVNRTSAVHCRCCGLGYYAAEYVLETSTVLQISAEEAEKVCLNCRNAQAVILWFKTLNYVHTMTLHEGTKAVLQDVRKYKSSFKLRRRLSARLELAADLLEEGKLSGEEFEELRVVDHSYRRELLYEESIKLKGAVDAFGDDMQTIIDVILNSSLIDKGGRWSQQSIILKVLDVADRAPDIVDFYMPQLLQAHLIMSETRTVEGFVKLDLFQQALLVIAQKYPALGLKLTWGLVATVGDYQEKRCSQLQYSACVALLLQLEMVTTGYVSSIADVPTCKLLAGVLQGAMHQQQEVGFEISILFLVRRRLQELNDDEELDRKVRKGIVHPDDLDEQGRVTNPSKYSSVPPKRAGPFVPSDCSCLELLYQLGVGQAGRSRFSDSECDSGDSGTSSDDSDGDEAAGKSSTVDADGNPSSGHKKGHHHGKHTKPKGYKDVVHTYLGFQSMPEQLDFINKLNIVVESLRFIDRPLRTKCLLKEVAKWNENPLKELGWDPTTIAGEPFYRIMHIVASECRVFRTKARAPSMLVCEVLRDDLVPYYLDSLKHIGASSGANFNEGISRTASANHVPEKQQSIELPLVNSPFNRRAPNPIFVNNVDAQTIDASIADAQIDSQDRIQEEPSGKGPVELPSGFTSHDLSAVYAASETHSSLKALHVEREKFATVARNINNVADILTTTGKVTAVHLNDPEPLPEHVLVREKGSPMHALKRGDNIKQDSDSGACTPRSGAATPGSQVHSVRSPVESDAGAESNTGSKLGTSFISRAQTIMRRASRSVLASNRLSVKGVGELARQTSAVNSVVGFLPSTPPLSGSPAPPMPHGSSSSFGNKEDFHISNAIAQQQHHMSPAGNNMQMSASGVFSPAPAPSSSVQSPEGNNDANGAFVDADSVNGDSNDEGFGQYDTADGDGSFDSSSLPAGTSQVTKKVLSSAQRLLAAGLIDPLEYELLIASDQNFQDETAREEAVIARNRVEDAFGESWEAKRERILGDRLYMFGYPSEDVWPSWDLRSFIMKSNDDLRQEVCCLQLMQLFKEIFEHFGLQNSLYLKPYRIISTGSSTGLVQVLSDAMSLDALKKTEGFTTLSAYFQKTYDTSTERYNTARMNFASSLAAYSLFSYLLLIKDRHNGNLMIDSDGHILHIDFGFLLSIAPGGSFSLETAPFKLTEEMVEVLGGLDSPLFGEFLTAFTKGFIALQSNAENIISALQILSHNSSFPCFSGKQASAIIEKLRGRFRTELSVNDAVKHCLDLITNSYGHYGTRQYDTFQWMTNGIMP